MDQWVVHRQTMPMAVSLGQLEVVEEGSDQNVLLPKAHHPGHAEGQEGEATGYTHPLGYPQEADKPQVDTPG